MLDTFYLRDSGSEPIEYTYTEVSMSHNQPRVLVNKSFIYLQVSGTLPEITLYVSRSSSDPITVYESYITAKKLYTS